MPATPAALGFANDLMSSVYDRAWGEGLVVPLTTLWLDMDAYFASAEQHLRPELRGRPVGGVPAYTAEGRPRRMVEQFRLPGLERQDFLRRQSILENAFDLPIASLAGRSGRGRTRQS